jgi:6-phosphogluconolactonase (cycloisomerase 2 family)
MYVANEGSQKDPVGSISGFTLDPASGALKPLPGSPFTADDSPNVMASDPLSHFVFVGEADQPVGVRGANCNGTNSVLLSERVDASSGALTLADRKVLTGDCVSSIAVDPTGTNLYVGMESQTGATPGAIQGFIISSSGTLTEMTGSPFPVNSAPLGLAMHPSGKFLYGSSDGGLQILDRNTTTGALTLRGTFNTPKRQLALNPAGTFLAASELNSNGVSQFNVDPTTGDVTAVSTDQNVPVNSPGAIAPDPLGSFFAVTEISDPSTQTGGISTLSLTNTGGTQLVKTTGSPFVSGHVPDGVAFDPAGKFVYVADSNDGNIAGFTLDRSTGKLTPIGGSPFASGTFPASVTVVKPH